MKTKRRKFVLRDGRGRFAPKVAAYAIGLIAIIIAVVINSLAIRVRTAFASVPVPDPVIEEAVKCARTEPEVVEVPAPQKESLPVSEKRVEAPSPKPRVITGANKPTQEQKDATAIACAHAWERHQTKMQEWNVSHGLYLTTCYSTLMGIAQSESGFRNNAKNESSIEMSYGAFQINRDVHTHISVAQAEDFVFAVNWTIERLHVYGFPRYLTNAVQCHNGCGANNGYAQKVLARAEQYK